MSTEPTKVPELGASSDKNDILTNSGAGFFQVASGFGLRLSQDLFPKREDFNGLFNLLSKPLNWFCKGGFFAWDSDIASGGGYPIRAIVKATDNSGYYSNLVDNNTSNPDTGGAGWEFIPTDIVSQAEAEAGTATIPRVWTAQRVKQAIDALTSTPLISLQKSQIKPGMINLWSGTITTIPQYWHLCDGTNGTPDLTDKFVIGASSDDAGIAKTNITGTLTKTGGSKDAVVVQHNHGITDPGHFHTSTTYEGGLAGAGAVFDVTGHVATPENTSTKTTGITINTEGVAGTDKNLPPYYALAYIMYTGV